MEINHGASNGRFIRLFSIVLVIFILLCGTSVGNDNYQELRPAISYPGNIPDLHNFKTSTIEQGGTGELKFNITNRYDFSEDNTISNVTLEVTLYDYTTLETHKSIDDIDKAPRIVSGSSALLSIEGPWSAIFYWPAILENETVDVKLKIKSYLDTPEGRYGVRMHLNFSFNGTYFDMRSWGHFTQEQLEAAQESITDLKEPYEDKFIVGQLDLNILGVDGIIPDTTIRVLNPFPIWPFYVITGLAGFCIVLAVIFYLMDEKGYFPNTKRKLDGFVEWVNYYRYRRYF